MANSAKVVALSAAVPASSRSSQRRQTKPRKLPPTQAVAQVSSALNGALSPVLMLDSLLKLLPLFNLTAAVIEQYGTPALALALQESERYIPPRQQALSYAQRETLELNRERQAGYIVNATRRIAEELEKAAANGMSPEVALAEARARENRYMNMHAQASAQRVLAASNIDALASSYGNVLGWYSVEDAKTTPECAEANGKNFRVDDPPEIGYPGIVHMQCRCRPGPPFPNGEEMPGGAPTIIAASNYRRRLIREFVRHVRTESGVEFFGEPIGTPITEHEYEAVLAAKKAHRAAIRRAAKRGSVEPERGSKSHTAVRADDKRTLAQQTRSNFEHPVTGVAMSKTEIGDTYEELFQRHGAKLIAKRYSGAYAPISHAEGGARNTPLDFRLNHTFGGEIKTLSSRSTNQKTAIKREEIERKFAALSKAGLNPLLVVQVVDQDTGTVEVYTFPNFVSKTVRQMEYAGSYMYSQDDFREAQQAQGYWREEYNATG